jgi:hypothetical protein
MGDIPPIEAAMLLCRSNPNKTSYDDAKQTTTDELGPGHLIRLAQRLADIDKADHRPRTLRDWHQTARGMGLAYHSWIDDYMEATLPPAPPIAGTTPPEPQVAPVDLAMVATRQQLIDAFGSFTGMNATWFDNLTDSPALLAARKVTGRGGRGHIAEPLFSPFEVLQWLTNKSRRKGRSLSAEKGWALFESHFPRAYAAFSTTDPRTD